MRTLVMCLGRGLHHTPLLPYGLPLHRQHPTLLSSSLCTQAKIVQFPEALQTKSWSEKLSSSINLRKCSGTKTQEQQTYYLNDQGKKSQSKH